MIGMDGHFSAFSFVDRITLYETNRRIHGCYDIPPGLKDFPTALVAEAVGQLAAWAAMCALDFQKRPVAGLAASIEFLSAVRPGQRVELTVDLETVDPEAAAYHGTAKADGLPVVRLSHCVGPMVAVEEFDDPQSLRERFCLLRGAGAAPGAFAGVPRLALDHITGNDGKSLRATLQVPDHAPFFADHFPRRPVLPGALLMHSNLELVAALAMKLPPPPSGGKWAPRRVSDMKLRSFTPPGERLEIEASLHQISNDAATVLVETRKGKRVIGSSRVGLVPEGPCE
jgi:3-hydroxymyristoyl/3-hydroxydecanoyl-(acyl carrier protein) dehydratase